MFFGVYERLRFGPLDGLRVGRFRFGVNTSFVVWRLGSTWVESGPPNRWRQLRAFAQEQRLETVLVTHHHEDHSGNGGRLQELYGARVLAPALSLPLLQSGFPIQFYRRQVWGVPPRWQAEALPDSHEFQDGQGRNWQALPIPGHASDMVAYYLPQEGWLFSADLYVAAKVRYGKRDDRPDQEIDSLRRALQLPFEHLFCAHRGYVPNGRQALQAKLNYLTDLRGQCRELYRQGRSPREIQHKLLGREDHVSYLSGFHFCKSNLIRTCLV